MKPKLMKALRLFLFVVIILICTENAGASADGSIVKPFSVSDAIRLQDSGKYWVQGFIVGCVKSNGTITSSYSKTNLALGSDPVGTAHLSIQLPNNAVREVLNLLDHPENVGKRIKIYGSFTGYYGVPGVKSVTSCEWYSGPGIIVSPAPARLTVGSLVKLKITGVELTEDIVLLSEDETGLTVSPSRLPADAVNEEVIIRSKQPGDFALIIRSDTIEERIVVTSNAKSKDNFLSRLKVGKEVLKLKEGLYEYTAKPVSFDSLSIEVEAEPNDREAKIIKGTGRIPLKIGENTINIWIESGVGTIRVYSLHIVRKCDPPFIVRHPENASVCRNKTHTFKVKASGNGLSYQWFREELPIVGAVNETLLLDSLDFEKDYGYYYVKIAGGCGSVSSDKARLWISDPLPSPLLLDAPDTLPAGSRCKVRVGEGEGYKDVTRYKWTFSEEEAWFYWSTGDNTPVTYLNVGSGSGTLKAEITHVCGKRSVSKRIKVIPGTAATGTKELIEEQSFRVFTTSDHELFIENNAGKIDNILIFNLRGQSVYSGKDILTSQIVLIKDWEPGVYPVVITVDGSVYKRKIIKW